MNPPYEPCSSNPFGHTPHTPRIWVGCVCCDTESIVPVCRNGSLSVWWSTQHEVYRALLGLLFAKREPGCVGVGVPVPTNLHCQAAPALALCRWLWQGQGACSCSFQTAPASTLVTGPELTLQLWPRIQKGSTAGDAPLAIPDPGNSPTAQKDGQRECWQEFLLK